MRNNDCVCYCHDIDPTNQQPVADCAMCGCTQTQTTITEHHTKRGTQYIRSGEPLTIGATYQSQNGPATPTAIFPSKQPENHCYLYAESTARHAAAQICTECGDFGHDADNCARY